MDYLIHWGWVIPAFIFGMIVQQEIQIIRMRRAARETEESQRALLDRMRAED